MPKSATGNIFTHIDCPQMLFILCLTRHNSLVNIILIYIITIIDIIFNLKLSSITAILFNSIHLKQYCNYNVK